RFPNIFTRWTSISSYLYVRLADGVGPEAVEAGFPAFADRHEVKPQGVESYLEMKPRDFVHFKMLNVQDIHLYSEGLNDFKPQGSVFTVVAFTAIAVLLVAIAVVNFINLATAIATRRVREVAMRKTLGAMRRQIMVQFLGEAGLMVIVSLALALVMVEAALPYYNEMLGSRLSLGVLVTPLGALGLAGFALFVGVAAGAYPAFRISGIRPGRVLHSNRSGFAGSGRLRSLLVTFQFAISIALIAGTIVLYQQTSFVNDLELGYQTDNITVLRLGGSTDGHGDALRLKQALLGIPGVESVGISGAVPSDVNIGSVAIFSPVLPGDTSVSVRPVIIGYDFFDTYGIEPLDGRLISQDYPSDIIPVYQPPQEPTQADGAVLLNESAVRKLGFENNQQAMGQVLNSRTGGLLDTELTIVGIIPDIHFESAREQIQPAIYYYLPIGVGSLSIRIRPGQYEAAQEAIDQAWRAAMPTTPMLKQHMDQLILDQYQPEQRQSYVLTGFSVLTILVACLGLFGLAAFSAERRTKEVGIRKVMGASTAEIVRLFVWSFSKPLLVANVIAWPAAWYVMDDWLTSFAYRIDLTAPPFLISGLAVAILGGITVAGRTFAAAKARPINALRYE
ncbi:MAG: FtsX-like permease family protein, partial [Sphingomonadales bacterium]